MLLQALVSIPTTSNQLELHAGALLLSPLRGYKMSALPSFFFFMETFLYKRLERPRIVLSVAVVFCAGIGCAMGQFDCLEHFCFLPVQPAYSYELSGSPSPGCCPCPSEACSRSSNRGSVVACHSGV